MSEFEKLFSKYDRLFFFDTETTGLEFSRDEIIEFAAVVVENRGGKAEIIEEYDELITLSPGGFVPPMIEKLTGISNQDIRERGIPKTRLCADIARMLSGNTLLVEAGHTASNRLTDPTVFNTGNVEVEVMPELGSEDTVVKSFKYADLAMSTSVRMENLYVKSIYTTNNGGDNDGAMTLTCEVDGQTIVVRTIVLRDANGRVLTQEDFLHKTIDVTGIVDYFSGEYQIKVFTAAEIVVHD